MIGLPVVLNVFDRRCVVVGGAAVARRRAASLLEAGARVTVIAPRFDPDIAAMPVETVARPYRSGDLQGAMLVVIATDDAAVNDQVAAEARRLGVLINRTDDPDRSDLSVMAHTHHGPVTVAVHTGGVSAAAAAAIRRQLSDALDPDWPAMLRVLEPWRDRLQRAVAESSRRQGYLSKLGGPEAMRAYKSGGKEALERHCESLVEQALRT
jgi:precorrin-2 dehydrogenase/sirohydrochlorin ferrochelatase